MKIQRHDLSSLKNQTWIRGWKLNNWITIIHYSLLFSPNYSLFISIFFRDIRYSFFSFCINFPFRNFLQRTSLHWLSKVYISVCTQPHLEQPLFYFFYTFGQNNVSFAINRASLQLLGRERPNNSSLIT